MPVTGVQTCALPIYGFEQTRFVTGLGNLDLWFMEVNHCRRLLEAETLRLANLRLANSLVMGTPDQNALQEMELIKASLLEAAFKLLVRAYHSGLFDETACQTKCEIFGYQFQVGVRYCMACKGKIENQKDERCSLWDQINWV